MHFLTPVMVLLFCSWKRWHIVHGSRKHTVYLVTMRVFGSLSISAVGVVAQFLHNRSTIDVQFLYKMLKPTHRRHDTFPYTRFYVEDQRLRTLFYHNFSYHNNISCLFCLTFSAVKIFWSVTNVTRIWCNNGKRSS